MLMELAQLYRRLMDWNVCGGVSSEARLKHGPLGNKFGDD
jgi:hypothetical protein